MHACLTSGKKESLEEKRRLESKKQWTNEEMEGMVKEKEFLYLKWRNTKRK